MGCVHRVLERSIRTKRYRITIEPKSGKPHAFVIHTASYHDLAVTVDCLTSPRVINHDLRLTLRTVRSTAVTVDGISIIALFGRNHRKVEITVTTDRLAAHPGKANPLKVLADTSVTVFQNQVLAGDAVITKIERARICIITVEIFETDIGNSLQRLVGTTREGDE